MRGRTGRGEGYEGRKRINKRKVGWRKEKDQERGKK